MKKKFIKLSVKLTIWISIAVIIASGVMGYIMYKGFSMNYESQFRDKLLSIAKASALLVDVEKHERLTGPADMETMNYKTEREKLQKLQNETGVKYIYTMRKKADKLIFVVDASNEDPSNIGDVYDETIEGIDKAFKGISCVDDDFYTDDWGTFLSAYAPIKNNNGEIIAIAGVDIEAKDVIEFRNTAKFRFIILFAIFTLIVIASTIIAVSKITKPINTVAKRMNETADVGGDLTQRIRVSTNDEIGRLSLAFNKLFDTIHEIMKKVRETTEFLTATSQELTASMEVSRGEIRTISEKSASITDGVDNVSKLFEEMKNEIGDFSSNSQEITARAEELDNFAQSLKTSAEGASNAVKGSMKSISDLAVISQDASKGVAELEQLTQSISSIVETISGIAKQTNLLALNAMIEAQRAGEAGRGFVVVAENIRSLSIGTQNSVQQIRNLVETVVSRINKIVDVQRSFDPNLDRTIGESRYVESSLGEIFNQFGDMAEMISQISAANENQALGIQKVVSFCDEIFSYFKAQAEAIHFAAEATRNFDVSNDEIAAQAETISKIADDLDGLIRNFKI